VTTVLFSSGINRRGTNPSASIFRTTPSTCHGWDEQAGKYFVHDRLSLRSVSCAGDNVSR
jgi:hypothetical protein